MCRLVTLLFISFISLASSVDAQTRFCVDSYTIETRIPVLEHCKRLHINDPLAKYLRGLPLKTHGADVMLYNGNTKNDASVHSAVLDQDIGSNDLHQCADAIIRLKADYHYQRKEYDNIAFNFTNGHRVAYSKWKEGYRIEINGNKTKWVKRGQNIDNEDSYWQYLEQIFVYAGTYSLGKGFKPVRIDDMKCGDVFIQGAFPGHAIMVVDMAIDTLTNKKYCLLGQSYMPAQQFHILINPDDLVISPWYELKGGNLITPEWTFTTDQLKGWR